MPTSKGLKGLMIVAALLAGGTSLAMAQSGLPWEYIVAPGVFIARPGYGVAPGMSLYPRDMPWPWRIFHRRDAIHHGMWGATIVPAGASARTK